MHRPLTKTDLCWVLIKLAGFYFVYLAAAGLWGAFVGWRSMIEVADSLPGNRSGAMWAPIKGFALGSLLPLAVGLYLLRSGRAVHRCLMRVPIGSEEHLHEADSSGTSLSAAEMESFRLWIDSHPQIRSRDLVDQIALFRDAQRSGDAP